MQLIENGQHTSLHVQGDTEFAQMGSGMGPAGAGKKEDLVNCTPGIRPLPLSSPAPPPQPPPKFQPILQGTPSIGPLVYRPLYAAASAHIFPAHFSKVHGSAN
jgi:hypothetical protein